jgi:hypothetical protein
MARRLLLKATLVPEASGALQEEIKKEIRKEFCKGLLTIPWCQDIEDIKVED